MKEVAIKGVTIGDGTVKICIPLSGADEKGLLCDIEYVRGKPCDLIEWRADFWDEACDKDRLTAMMKTIKRELSDKVFLFTYRTQEEGGSGNPALSDYMEICKYVIDSGLPDIIDVEYRKAKDFNFPILEEAHDHGIKVLTSYHRFDEPTPDLDTMIKILREQQQFGADIAKLAVMAQNDMESNRIIEASREMYGKHAKIPFILIGMGQFGSVTRAIKPFHGSSVTFARGREATAPGQLSIEDLLAERSHFDV